MAGNSQKFIGRNRAPRVQIEYDVEVYGAQKKVELPFVMGVMADLSGKSEVPLPPVADRNFLEVSVDNFDERMKAMKPRIAMQVQNTLTGEGSLPVARQVEPLRALLEARTQLSNLITFMDGKTGAEDLIRKVLQDPALLKALAAAPKPEEPPAAPAPAAAPEKGKKP